MRTREWLLVLSVMVFAVAMAWLIAYGFGPTAPYVDPAPAVEACPINPQTHEVECR